MGARVSFDPDKQTKAGGIPDDIDATIVGARAGYFDYPGTVITAVCLLLDIEDDNGQRYEGVPYTVGGKITPTEDGTGFEFDTDRDDGASFNDKTGAGKFFRELGNAGAKRLVVEASGDCTRLVGPAMDHDVVGRVDAEGEQLLLDGLGAERQDRRPLVTDGEHRMRRGSRRREGVVVAGVGLAERRRVGHEPARVDGLAERADLDADHLRGDRTGAGVHEDGGKFMESTKISSK